MNDKSFDFFQDHSLHYLEMALRFDRHEMIKNPDGHGKKCVKDKVGKLRLMKFYFLRLE